MVLLFAELVSNAVKYGEAAAPVVVCPGHGSVRLDVYDATGRHPRMPEHRDASGGFGLHIVDRLSTAWGW